MLHCVQHDILILAPGFGSISTVALFLTAYRAKRSICQILHVMASEAKHLFNPSFFNIKCFTPFSLTFSNTHRTERSEVPVKSKRFSTSTARCLICSICIPQKHMMIGIGMPFAHFEIMFPNNLKPGFLIELNGPGISCPCK